MAKNNFHDVSKIYILVSGDIAHAGSKDEYQKFKTFLSSINLVIKSSYKDIQIGYVFVPGNHDCDFSKNTDLRNNVLKNMNYEGLGSDSSIVNQAISVQEDFWGCYGFYNSIPNDRLFYQIIDRIEKHTICFHCINTAWMSQRHEETGKLFYPVKKYEKYLKENNFDLNIGVWHHPLNWLTPNTNENNKNEFQKFIETIAPIHFIGHEHESSHYLNVNKNEGIASHIISGKLFNDDKKPSESGFKTIVINILTKETKLKSYEWKNDHFKEITEDEMTLNREISRAFTLRSEFKNELEDLHIPLVFANKKSLELDDLFVFPDMEITSSKVSVL